MVPVRFLFLLLFLFTFRETYPQLQRYTFVQNKIGSPFTLIMYASNATTANIAAKQSYRLIDSLNSIFSDYDKKSELSRLNSTAGLDSFVKVSPVLFHLVRRSIEASDKSKGAFSITMGPLSLLWRESRKTNVFPTAEQVAKTLHLTGNHLIIIDTVNQAVKLMKSGMRLDFGGIAKGFIAQEVVNHLTSLGITHALADAGGDIVCSKPPPNKKGWTIAINLPEGTLEHRSNQLFLKDAAVATSGNTYQYIKHGGKKYSHIIDPKTGYGITSPKNVTVIANNGALADWLATACSILPYRKALQLVRKYHAEIVMVNLKNKKLIYKTSRGIKKLLVENS